MAEIITCEIRCLHSNCRNWFRSPIQFGGIRPFDSAGLKDNLAQCLHCGQMTGCNKENMRYEVRNRETGEVYYVEGEDV